MEHTPTQDETFEALKSEFQALLEYGTTIVVPDQTEPDNEDKTAMLHLELVQKWEDGRDMTQDGSVMTIKAGNHTFTLTLQVKED